MPLPNAEDLAEHEARGARAWRGFVAPAPNIDRVGPKIRRPPEWVVADFGIQPPPPLGFVNPFEMVNGKVGLKGKTKKVSPPEPQGEYKVKDYIARRSVNGDFGVEIEVEGNGLYLPGEEYPYWGYKKDGSLRNGLEYVFKKPLPIEKAKEAISAIGNSSNERKIVFSFRTSVHVHVDVLELTCSQLRSFLYLSHILEDALVKYSGESREGNRFCLRMRDAEWKIGALKAFFSEKGLKKFSIDDMKYSAINLVSLHMFGSIEFRSMRGTFDTGVLFPWLDVLYRIRDFAMHNSVKDIDKAVRLSPEGTAIEVFGEHFDKFNYPNLEKDIKEAHCRLIELPHIKGV